MSPLSDEDGRFLLEVAHRALEEAVCERPRPNLDNFPAALANKAGAFVTLRHHGSLRGCIGQVEPRQSLVATVMECSASAALHDPRFPRVEESELPGLSIEINVLSPPFDIGPEDIEIGRHGLIVSSRFARGLLLPEVAVDWNWDVERYLDETCRKAGLPKGAWQRDARIQAFTTQAFAEPGFRAVVPGDAEVRSPKHR